MLYGLLIFVHVIVSLLLIVSVLLQSSKGGGLAGTFGGSGGMGGGVFGGRGAAPFLTKATTVCAILFMLTSLSLNFVSSSPTANSALERAIKDGEFGSAPAVTNEMPIMTDDVQAVPGDTSEEAGTGSEAENGTE